MKIEDRPGACAIVYSVKDDKVLMGRRSDTKKWSFAGGKAEPEDKDLLYTATRELEEEFGVKLDFDHRKFTFHNLGSAVVPGYKRIKHEGLPDTFEETLYNTQIFIFLFCDTSEAEETMVVKTDGEMSELKWIKVDDIFTLDKLMLSTVSVSNVLKYYLRR